MGRFGAVGMKQVRAADMEEGGGNYTLMLKDAKSRHKYQVPLSKLSVALKPPNFDELTLKRPAWSTALMMITRLIPYYWTKNSFNIKVRVIISLSIIFFSKGINLYVPLLFKNIINEATIGVPMKTIMFYGLLLIIQKSVWDIRDVIFQPVTDSATRNVSLETFDHLQKLSLSFHHQKRTGAMIKVIERGTNSIVTLLSLLLFNIFPTLLELATVSVFLLFTYGATFAFINLSSCVFYIMFTLTVTEWRNQFRRLANRKESEASDVRMDSLSNFETIKYFTSEEYELKRYDNALLDYFIINAKARITYFFLNVGQSTIITIGTVMGLLFCTYGASAGALTVGDIIAINTYIAQMFQPLAWLGTSYRMIIQSFTDMESLIELLETKPEIVDEPNALPLLYEGTLPSVEFRNVSFSYKNDDRLLLDDISFVVPPGKSVAIVGPTGAGKSTIFRLLCRFYDVKGGQVLVGGKDVRDVQQISLRQAIGVVPQEAILFHDTIAYNLAFGKRDCSDEELIEAAKRAQIYDFIDQSPEGFSTVVGERGLRLSGGEKQRVSIARTILKNPDILILDEATSALDVSTEKKIQESLNDISQGRTTLVIAHRLSTIINCDEILVLKDGSIIERGNHQQLLAAQGEYHHLWTQQADKISSNSNSSNNSTNSPVNNSYRL
ncbi:ABC transporter B family protein [Cavenderia fasciculata]|uniref:ABC transporter B family protein n=1 Tax=Cavenderia fasciculata TaxID=261658 RepID=F4QF43_CACFS|nr:ABC transporter B family protein [Cavenderia fasciculata]EGG14197.1 ABC transporter B family protein [Cavenderia fasciculata]|eukprot:XP_004350905.1 ABC transporter B family protein [Cavenderia fasciculata]